MLTQTTVCGRIWGVQHRTTYIGIHTEGGGKDWTCLQNYGRTRANYGGLLCAYFLDYYWG